MQVISSRHKLFHFHLLNGRITKKELQKFEHLQNEMSFLDEIKNIFHIF